MTDRQYALLGVVGGILAVAGSLLPWATLTTGFGTISVNGTEGDGIITLFFGAVAALAGFLRFNGNERAYVRVAPAVIGVLVGLIAINDALGVRGSASVGIGLWLVLLGAVASIISVGRGRVTTP